MSDPQMTTETGEQRSATIVWTDPAVALGRRPGLTGREFLEASQRGDLPGPPIAALMDMSLALVEDGRVVIESTPEERQQNPAGVIHGGYAATLLDTAMGCAVDSLQQAGTFFITLELKINFIRPLQPGGEPLFAEGKVVHGGSRTATTEGTLRGSTSEKLFAHATSTLMRVA
jgi:uncharacterized protein (TIGR00369 family)